MFKSPIANTTNWNFALERMQVPVDNSLRYPGYSLNGLRISKTSGPEDLLVPVKSYIKVIQIGTDTWLELEPLLVSKPEISRRFETGFPVIYIKTAEADPSITEGVYNVGEVLGNVHEFSFAIQFTDRIDRDISHCCTMILAAIQGQPNTDSWSSFCVAIQDKADISFLRLNGSAFSDSIALIFESGGPDEPFTYIPGTTSLKTIINGRAGSLRLASPGNEANVRYLWVTTDALHQTRVSYGRASIVPETRIILLADLHEWFAPQSVQGTPTSLPRFTTGNRLRYFTNGPEFFDDIFKEIREAATDEVGAAAKFFLAGYSMFEKVKLINKTENNPETLEEAAKSIVEKAGQCYFLPLQLFEISAEGQGPVSPDTVVAIAALVALVLAETGLLVQIGSKGITPLVGVVGPLPLVATGLIMVFATTLLDSDFVLEKIQKASAEVENLDFTNANGGKSRKTFALHPAHWDDNPHQGDDSLFLVGLSKSMLRGTTSYHQKIASVRNSQWVSYCGGLDFNIDRMDDAKHMNADPFHDVHARVTGAAAADIAVTFIERWNHENSKRPPGQPDDPIDINQLDLPQPPSSPITEGDIVQVARTNFKVNQTNGAVRQLPYAPEGDRTILDTLLLAISNAKEYIYIEDQFLAPPKAFRDALLAAIDNGLKSLVIMLPSTPEQVYGETQRERFIDELLLKNAGREVPVVRVGYPRRNYTLPKTSTEKLVGRLKTGKDMTETDGDIFLGPVSRVPTLPFYISVEGEIMLVTGKGPGMSEVDAVVDGVVTPGFDDSFPKYQQYRVERQADTNFYDKEKGCAKRAHRAGTPATVVVFSGIYVHAKCMLVDDVFLSIGSANMNRRGLYGDAEANVFSIPSQLRFTANNPVRELRKELWAAHLNLPISLGKVLLEDPVSASRLFDRRADSGNRFIPYKAVSNNVRSFANKIGNISIDATSISGLSIVKATFAALLLTTEAFDFDEIYFHASDPSSFTENPIEDIDV